MKEAVARLWGKLKHVRDITIAELENNEPEAAERAAYADILNLYIYSILSSQRKEPWTWIISANETSELEARIGSNGIVQSPNRSRVYLGPTNFAGPLDYSKYWLIKFLLDEDGQRIYDSLHFSSDEDSDSDYEKPEVQEDKVRRIEWIQSSFKYVCDAYNKLQIDEDCIRQIADSFIHEIRQAQDLSIVDVRQSKAHYTSQDIQAAACQLFGVVEDMLLEQAYEPLTWAIAARELAAVRQLLDQDGRVRRARPRGRPRMDSPCLPGYIYRDGEPLAAARLFTRSNLFLEDEVVDMVRPSLWRDIAELREWLSYCDEHHMEHCHLSETSCNIFRHYPQWLVDVHTKRLVPGQRDSRYVALSYVWGEEIPFQTVTSNVGILQQDYAILGIMDPSSQEPRLADAVIYAIELVKRMGETHL